MFLTHARIADALITIWRDNNSKENLPLIRIRKNIQCHTLVSHIKSVKTQLFRIKCKLNQKLFIYKNFWPCKADCPPKGHAAKHWFSVVHNTGYPVKKKKSTCTSTLLLNFVQYTQFEKNHL